MVSGNLSDGIPPDEHLLICTRCAEDLENFCFSPQSYDLESLKKRFEECRLKGIASGEICAKLFIATPGDSL
jgi:hypothetical protein